MERDGIDEGAGPERDDMERPSGARGRVLRRERVAHAGSKTGAGSRRITTHEERQQGGVDHQPVPL